LFDLLLFQSFLGLGVPVGLAGLELHERILVVLVLAGACDDPMALEADGAWWAREVFGEVAAALDDDRARGRGGKLFGEVLEEDGEQAEERVVGFEVGVGGEGGGSGGGGGGAAGGSGESAGEVSEDGLAEIVEVETRGLSGRLGRLARGI